jgi:hypothetical protein
VSPVSVLVTPPFLGGCTVDCDSTFACAGNSLGGDIAIYDISNPASPTLNGSIISTLGGIGAVSVAGSRVLAGEVSGLRLILVDISNPSSPTIVSTFNSSISSIASVALKGTHAVASGVNDPFFVALDYTNPTEVKFAPGTGGVFFQLAPVVCDLDGTNAVVGEAGGSNVYLFDISGGSISLLGKFASSESGITSISISGSTAAASSSNDLTLSVVSFQNVSNPSETATPAGLSGGVTVKNSGSKVLAGAILGSNVSLFNVSGTAKKTQAI